MPNIILNKPTHSVDPNANTFGSDAERVTNSDIQDHLMKNPSAAVSLGRAGAKEPQAVKYHEVMNRASKKIVEKWRFFAPAYTETLNTWARSFAESISRDKASRFYKGDVDSNNKSVEAVKAAQGAGRGNMHINLNKDGTCPSGGRKSGEKVEFTFVKDIPGGIATKGFNQHFEALFHGGDKKIRENRRLIEKVAWFKEGLISHAEVLSGAMHYIEDVLTNDNNSSIGNARSRLLGAMSSLLNIDKENIKYDKLEKKIDALSESDLKNLNLNTVSELLEVFGYDADVAKTVFRLACDYNKRKSAWEKDENGILSRDKVGDEDLYTYFDHQKGGEKSVIKDKKVAIEAKRDLNMRAQLVVLKEFEDELKQEFVKIGGAGASRFGGNTYNCGLYGQNPHDKAREWTTLIELKWLVDGGTEYTPKHMYGPCGAMQMPAWLLGGVLSAVHHSSALTSLWCPHNGDFHGVDGLQLDPNSRTYGFVREGTELYEQFTRKKPELILKRDAENVNPSNGQTEKGIVVPIDCVHSQNFLFINGTEDEMARNLRRLWGYKSDAEVKVSSVATKRDGTDTQYLQMRGGDETPSKKIVGRSVFANSPGLYDIHNNTVDVDVRQEALVIEGLELYKKGWKNQDQKDISNKPFCVANFTQNHDDAFHEHTEFDQEHKNGWDASGKPNYHDKAPNTYKGHHHDHGCSEGHCSGKDAHRGHLIGTVVDNADDQTNLAEGSEEFLSALEEPKVKAYLLDSLIGNERKVKAFVGSIDAALCEQAGWSKGAAWYEKKQQEYKGLKADCTLSILLDNSALKKSGKKLYEAAMQLSKAVAGLAEFEAKIDLFPVKEIFDLIDQLEALEPQEIQEYASAIGVTGVDDADASAVMVSLLKDSRTQAQEDNSTMSYLSYLLNEYRTWWGGSSANDDAAVEASSNVSDLKNAIEELMSDVQERNSANEIKQKLKEACQRVKFIRTKKSVNEKLKKLCWSGNNGEFVSEDVLNKLNGFASADGISHRVIETLVSLKNSTKPNSTNAAAENSREPSEDDISKALENLAPYGLGSQKVALSEFSTIALNVLATIDASLDRIEERIEAHSDAEKALKQIENNKNDKNFFNQAIFKPVPEVKVLPSRGRENSRGSHGLLTPGFRGLVSNSTWLSGVSAFLSGIGTLSSTAGVLLTGFTMPFSGVLAYIGFEGMRSSIQEGRRLKAISEITSARLDKVSDDANKRVKHYNDEAVKLQKEVNKSLNNPILNLIKQLENLSKDDSGVIGKGARYLYKQKGDVLLKSLRSLLKGGKLNVEFARYGAGNGSGNILPNELKRQMNSVIKELDGMCAYVKKIGVNDDGLLQSLEQLRQALSPSSSNISNDDASLIDKIDELNKHCLASNIMLKQSRALNSSNYMNEQKNKDNAYSLLTSIGYFTTAGGLLTSSVTYVAGVASAAMISMVAAPIALGVLSLTYSLNALKANREMSRLGKIKKQIEAVDLNKKESFSSVIVGQHQALLDHIQERMEFLRTNRNRWARGAFYTGAMALGVASASILSGGAAAPVASMVAGALVIGLSGPLAYDTYHLFNRDANWGSLYSGRSEDSQDLNDVKIDSPQHLKKLYWSKSKMLALLGEKTAEMMERIGKHERNMKGDGVKVGEAFNFKVNGRSIDDSHRYSDRIQNTRAGGMDKSFAKHFSLQGFREICRHMRSMYSVVHERFFNPNFSQATMSDNIAKYMDTTFSSKDSDGKDEYLLRSELVYGMKDYVLHKINYLNHFQQELENNLATLTKSDHAVYGSTCDSTATDNTTKHLIAIELDRVSDQIQTLQLFINSIEKFNIATNHGKYKPDSSSADGSVPVQWEDLALQFMVATGAVNQLLQKRDSIKGSSFIREFEANENQKYSYLQPCIAVQRYQGRFGGHIGKIDIKAKDLLGNTDAMNQLKALMAKSSSKQVQSDMVNKNLADTMVYILPGLDKSDILTMFERFEIPNRMDLRSVQSGINHFNSSLLPWGKKTYVEKKGDEYVFSGGFWSNCKVKTLNGYQLPRVANLLMERFDAA